MAQEIQTGARYQPRGGGMGGRGEGGSKRRGYMCTYGWFLLRFDRKQHNSVKQLSFNKRNKFKKKRLLLTIETDISNQYFSPFLRMGRCKSPGQLKSFSDTHLNSLGPPCCFSVSWVSLCGARREEVRRTAGADGFMGMKSFVYWNVRTCFVHKPIKRKGTSCIIFLNI